MGKPRVASVGAPALAGGTAVCPGGGCGVATCGGGGWGRGAGAAVDGGGAVPGRGNGCGVCANTPRPIATSTTKHITSRVMSSIIGKSRAGRSDRTARRSAFASGGRTDDSCCRSPIVEQVVQHLVKADAGRPARGGAQSLSIADDERGVVRSEERRVGFDPDRHA